MRVGDVLVAVNNRDVLHEELEDVVEFIDMIRYQGLFYYMINAHWDIYYYYYFLILDWVSNRVN